MTDFAHYRKKQIAEMRPYVPGEDVTGITISETDAENGSPRDGDMIARDPANHVDQWLVSATFFAANYERVSS